MIYHDNIVKYGFHIARIKTIYLLIYNSSNLLVKDMKQIDLVCTVL